MTTVSDIAAAFVEGEHDRAVAIAKAAGMPVPDRPKDVKSFPESLGDISADELGEHLSYWAAMASYSQFQVSILDGATTIASVEAEQEFDARYSMSTETTVTDRRHMTGASRAVRTKQKKAARLRADLKVLSALHWGYEKKYQAISRELTRRTSEYGRS